MKIDNNLTPFQVQLTTGSYCSDEFLRHYELNLIDLSIVLLVLKICLRKWQDCVSIIISVALVLVSYNPPSYLCLH